MHLTDSFHARENFNGNSSEMQQHIELTSLRVMVI